ncbi:MAG TPA: hypothetical protein VMI31_12905 [Fimbriimonadaceae bacterium]|nr:hypothetical protein [Fimbriimonadaceae bacterium]
MVWAALFLPLLPRGGTLDLNARAMSAGQLLERISAEAGTRLMAAPSVAQKVVFVDVKGATLDEVKSRIADALAATWKQDGSIQLLTRTATDDKKIWQSHVAYRRKLVEQAIKDARADLDKPFDAHALAAGLEVLGSEPTLDSDRTAARKYYEREQALYGQSPSARLLDRLVLACDPNDLAAVGPYERHLFRVNPTPMQHGFDGTKYQAALGEFAKEQRAWIDEAAKHDFSDIGQTRMVSDPRVQVDTRPDLSDVSLEISRGEMTALFFANLTSEHAGPAGYGILAQRAFADPSRRFLDSQITPAPPANSDPVVTLSASSKEFEDALSRAFRSRQPGPASEGMRKRMTRLEQEDPLSWTVSDVLEADAEAKKLNVVAALPDSAVSLLSFVSMNGPLHLGQAMNALEASGTLDERTKDGWSTMTPPDRYEAELDFTPRAAVDNLMKSFFAAGRLDIHDYAKYAFDSKRLNRGGFGSFFLAMVDPSELGASDQTDWKALQLYGSFSSSQQRALEVGTKFAYAAMTPEQKRIVDRIVYAKRLAGPAGPGQASFQAVEPTQAFALGVPGNCITTAASRSTPVIVAYGKGTDGKTHPTRGLNVYTLASIELDVAGDPQKMAMYGVPDLIGYAMGTDRTVRLRVEVAPGVYSESTITVPDYDPDAMPAPWEKLPAPYAKQIESQISQMKSERAGQTGSKTPPPLH